MAKIFMRIKANLKNILYFGAILCLVVSFLILTYLSVVRYLDKETSYHVYFEDEKTILYPSVSICKGYAFDMDCEVKNLEFENETIESIIEMVSSNSWNIDDQFFFFTHPGIFNLTFPCTTTLGGTSPGKPCVFPIIDGDDYDDKCMYYDSSQLTCFTNIGQNNEYEGDGFYDWGYCPENCNGEVPGPASRWNLAKSNYSNIWTSYFYDLTSWDNGLCHTYDPPEKSAPDFLSRIYFMMASIEAGFEDYDVFIHEKGQFWPRSDMFSYGQPNKISVKNSTEIEIVFSSKIAERMRTLDNPCVEDNSYSLTRCIHEYTRRRTNCQFDVYQSEHQKVSCDEDDFKDYVDLLVKIKHGRITEVQEETGCYPKCKVVQYSYEVGQTDLTWPANWTAQVFVQPKSSMVEKTQEYYTFGVNDLISSIGGNLGLFLGWSLLTLLQTLSFFAYICRDRNFKMFK